MALPPISASLSNSSISNPPIPTAGLQNLPTEILHQIITYLATPKELLNLRATCHNIQNQTYEDFCLLFKTQAIGLDAPSQNSWWTSPARRRQRSSTDAGILSGSHKLQEYIPFLSRNPTIANLITALELTQRRRRDRGLPLCTTTTITSILPHLPNLKALEISHLNSSEMAFNFPPTALKQYLSQPHKISHLSITYCTATIPQLLNLIESFSPSLRSLGITMANSRKYTTSPELIVQKRKSAAGLGNDHAEAAEATTSRAIPASKPANTHPKLAADKPDDCHGREEQDGGFAKASHTLFSHQRPQKCAALHDSMRL